MRRRFFCHGDARLGHVLRRMRHRLQRVSNAKTFEHEMASEGVTVPSSVVITLRRRFPDTLSTSTCLSSARPDILNCQPLQPTCDPSSTSTRCADRRGSSECALSASHVDTCLLTFRCDQLQRDHAYESLIVDLTTVAIQEGGYMRSWPIVHTNTFQVAKSYGGRYSARLCDGLCTLKTRV